MMLQELITRGRFIFSGAPKRFEVFKLVNGIRSTKEIAIKIGRSLSSVLHDIEKLKDMELIIEKRDENDNILKNERAIIYEKVPLIKHVSLSYFNDVVDTSIFIKKTRSTKARVSTTTSIHIPNQKELLDIFKYGEDQLYEFKTPGTEMSKISKEISAFAHTKKGGIIFYGIEDDGSILGSDISRQEFDQRIQNSIRNTISPQLNIRVEGIKVMGSKIILNIIHPWDRKTLYQYTKTEKYYIRKGTNIFALKPDEIKKLSNGEYIV